MSEMQMKDFKEIICNKIEKEGIKAVPSGNYIVVRIPKLGTTYLKIEHHISNA